MGKKGIADNYVFLVVYLLQLSMYNNRYNSECGEEFLWDKF